MEITTIIESLVDKLAAADLTDDERAILGAVFSRAAGGESDVEGFALSTVPVGTGSVGFAPLKPAEFVVILQMAKDKSVIKT